MMVKLRPKLPRLLRLNMFRDDHDDEASDPGSCISARPIETLFECNFINKYAPLRETIVYVQIVCSAMFDIHIMDHPAASARQKTPPPLGQTTIIPKPTTLYSSRP